jgi:hypothetical protein
MTALEVLEWPIALVVGTRHALATHARNRELREFGGGARPRHRARPLHDTRRVHLSARRRRLTPLRRRGTYT